MRQKKHERKFFTIASVLTIVSAILYCSWPLGLWLNPIASKRGLASELGAYGQPYNWVFIWCDVASGILLASAAAMLIHMYNLKGWARLSLILLAVYGVCGAVDAALPMSCLPSEQVCGPVLHDPLLIVHGIFDLTGSTALFFTLVIAGLHVRINKAEWRLWVYIIGFGGTIFALMSGVFYVWGGPGYWAQRYYITLSCIWVMSMPFIFRPRRAILIEP